MVRSTLLELSEATLDDRLTNKMLKKIGNNVVIIHKEKYIVNNTIVISYTISLREEAKKDHLALCVQG